jgi:hypothetical protein
VNCLLLSTRLAKRSLWPGTHSFFSAAVFIPVVAEVVGHSLENTFDVTDDVTLI